MKKKLINLFLVAILLLVASPSFANVNVSTYFIKPEYIAYQRLIYNIDGTPTNFRVVGGFSTLGDLNNRATAQVVLIVGTVQTILGTTELSATWPSSNYRELTINAQLPAGVTSGVVKLKVIMYDANDKVYGTDYSTLQYQLLPRGYTPSGYADPFELVFNSNGTNRYHIKRLPEYQTPPVPGSQNVWYPSLAGPVMTRGQEVFSPNGQFKLQFQAADGNLILWKVSTGQALWASNKSNGQGLYFQPDGNLIISTAAGQMIWTSDVYISGGSYLTNRRLYLELQNDGNLVLKWDGITFTDAIAAAGTGGGIVSNHYGKFQ